MKKLFKLASKFHGVGPVVFAWHPSGAFLATAGKNGLVHIFDRQGEQYDEIGLDLTAPVLALEWDSEGSTLAILQQGSSVVPLWDNGTRSTLSLDTNIKDPTFARWSRGDSLLAVGTLKGNLVIYNKITRKLVPVVGKHSRRVTCGSWNGDDMLVLGGEDRMLTVSNKDGDTIEQRELSHTPHDVKFGRKRGDSMQAAEQLIAIALSRAVILFNLKDPANPVELTFQTHYGSIVFLEWFADGMVMIAFSEGYLIVISTKIDEVGEELQSHRFFSERIFAACYSPSLDRVAISGDSGIKVVDMASFTEVPADAIKLSDTEENEVHVMSFTSDGQILTVSTQGGVVQNFLARMPRIHDHYGHYVAYLSSLRELSVVDTRRREDASGGSNSPIRIALSVEPSFVAIGPRHVAVGMNNRVWFYRCDGSSADALVNEQQYLGRVASVKLNRDYAVVLCDGKASLHLIEPGSNGAGSASLSSGAELQDEQGKVFSGGGRDDRNSEISAVALTKDFFVYATTNGTGAIHFFYLAAWQFLDGCAYRHDDGVGIVQLEPNKSGTRVFFLDARRRGFVLQAATREVLRVPNLASSTSAVLWDTEDEQVFVALQPRELSVFQLLDATVRGAEVTQLGMLEVLPDGDVVIAPETTPVPADLAPVLVSNGVVTCQHAAGGGQLATLTAVTHDQLHKSSGGAADADKAAFRQNLSLLRLDEAWRLAARINQRDYWLALAGRAMHTLDVVAARRAYRALGDSGMVLGLDRLEGMEEKKLLAGHVCMLFGDYTEARRLFLSSSDPLAALHMQRHLLQWEQALKLADSLARELVPELSVSYATQLEFRGEFDAALKMYEHAASAIDSGDLRGAVAEQEESRLRRQSLAGVTRCTFRLGDLRRGGKLATELDDTTVFRECAAILESMKQTAEAAALYEQGGQPDRAAQLFVQMKNLARATPLMARVTTPKVHAQFARAQEAAGEFAAAAEAYERAGEMDSVVRLQLERLDGAERAFEIVRETKSSEGALAAARFCMEAGRYTGAIEFLLLANKEDEAFSLAQQHGEVDAFAATLGLEQLSAARAAQVAQHYELTAQQPERAAEFYQAAGNYHKALRLLLAVSASGGGGGSSNGGNSAADAALVRAIEVVGAARNDMLTHTLIDHLMGEQDGIPKDPHHIFRLYLALGNYAQAAKTAVIIARQEQELGNYKLARDVLVETSRQLRARRLRVARELQSALTLLHSYVLVKKLVKHGWHEPAARMLARVAEHLSRFPTHAANILISAVIECQRAGLRALSYDFAATLLRTPEHRGSMDKDIRRKIEAIVRRPNKEQAPDARSPCPYCDTDLPEAELDCPACKSAIPYCIVTGYHMLKDDWTHCPRCSFPARYSKFLEHLEQDATCPLCEQPLEAHELHKLAENEVPPADDADEAADATP